MVNNLEKINFHLYKIYTLNQNKVNVALSLQQLRQAKTWCQEVFLLCGTVSQIEIKEKRVQI